MRLRRISLICASVSAWQRARELCLDGRLSRTLFRQWTREYLGLALRAPFRTGRHGRVRVFGADLEVPNWEAFHFLCREVLRDLIYLAELDSETPTIVDGGANIGLTLFFFKNLFPNGRIIAFEPEPSTFAVLSRNVSHNRLSGVTLYPFALGSRDGTASFFKGSEVGDPRASLCSSRQEGASRIDVAVRRLSSFIDGEIDLLKLDVEGAEAEVLAELASTGKIRNVRRMLIEYHHHIEHQADASLASFLRCLEDNDFGFHIAGTVPLPAPAGEVFQDLLISAFRKTG